MDSVIKNLRKILEIVKVLEVFIVKFLMLSLLVGTALLRPLAIAFYYLDLPKISQIKLKILVTF